MIEENNEQSSSNEIGDELDRNRNETVLYNQVSHSVSEHLLREYSINDSIHQHINHNQTITLLKTLFLASDRFEMLLTENQVMKIIFYIIIWFYILLAQSGFVLSLMALDKASVDIQKQVIGYLEQPIAIFLALFYLLVYNSSYFRYQQRVSTYLEVLRKSRRILSIAFSLTWIAQIVLTTLTLLQMLSTWMEDGFILNLATITYLILSMSVLSKIFYLILFIIFEVTFKAYY